MDKPEASSQLQLVQQEFSRASEYASEYQGTTPIAHFFNTRLRRVGELLAGFQTGRVLDVGCGPAKIGHQFRGRPIEYCGVDASELMLEECRKTFGLDPRFRFSLGRLEELEFPEAHFDVVLCLGALEYVPDGQAAMRELARVTKAGGTVIATMHNPFSVYRLWLNDGYGRIRNALRKLRRLIGRRGYDRGAGGSARPAFTVHTEKQLRQCFAAAGLRVEDVVYYDFNIFLSPLDALLPRASVHVSRTLECLGRSLLKQLGSGFIIKGRKIPPP